MPDGIETKLITNNYARTKIECLGYCMKENNCTIIEFDKRQCKMYESFDKIDRSSNKTYFIAWTSLSRNCSGNFLIKKSIMNKDVKKLTVKKFFKLLN